MTQSVFRDLFLTKKKIAKIKAVISIFAAFFFGEFAWRALLAWVFAVAMTILWPVIPLWPVFGLFFTFTLFLPHR